MKPIDKRRILQELRAAVAREMDVIARAAHSARDAATHEENKPENDKDTRAVELAYLAGAQADRVRDLERVTNALEFMAVREFASGDPIALSALVEAELDGATLFYFLSPVAGGMKVNVDGIDVQVITPQSPFGQALVGKVQDDVVEFRAKQGLREYTIVAVH